MPEAVGPAGPFRDHAEQAEQLSRQLVTAMVEQVGPADPHLGPGERIELRPRHRCRTQPAGLLDRQASAGAGMQLASRRVEQVDRDPPESTRPGHRGGDLGQYVVQPKGAPDRSAGPQQGLQLALPALGQFPLPAFGRPGPGSVQRHHGQLRQRLQHQRFLGGGRRLCGTAVGIEVADHARFAVNQRDQDQPGTRPPALGGCRRRLGRQRCTATQ